MTPLMYLRLFGLLALCITVLTACSNQIAASIRQVTYPPEFKYIEPQKLRTDMSKLAQQMRLLDTALVTSSQPSESEQIIQRQKVLTALGNIERLASKLQTGEGGSTHSFMRDYMDDFVRRVGEARMAASLPQPRYYFAGQVAGGCINCHKVHR